MALEYRAPGLHQAAWAHSPSNDLAPGIGHLDDSQLQRAAPGSRCGSGRAPPAPRRRRDHSRRVREHQKGAWRVSQCVLLTAGIAAIAASFLIGAGVMVTRPAGTPLMGWSASSNGQSISIDKEIGRAHV